MPLGLRLMMPAPLLSFAKSPSCGGTINSAMVTAVAGRRGKGFVDSARRGKGGMTHE
jgi:hypothetical protein